MSVMTREGHSIGSNTHAGILTLVTMAFLVVLALPAAAQADTLYVSVVGSDTAGHGPLSAPYATLQKAVDVALSGDAVMVGPGTFTGDVTMKTGVSLYGAGASLTVVHGSGTTHVI